MRNKLSWWAGAALVALAIPAIAQVQSAPQPAPVGQVEPARGAEPPASATQSTSGGSDEGHVQVIDTADAAKVVKSYRPIEYPQWAKRDPKRVGALDPSAIGLGDNPWGGADGRFLSTLMRRMDTPLASRWAHIALRDALLASTDAPTGVHPIDWVAERVWLLLRMGEADAARLLVAGVDTTAFTPKMTQVAVQSALADADPPALCPLKSLIRKYDAAVRPMVSAMCSSLSGEPQVAAAQIDDARRYGRIGGIDLRLAEKVVGAGSNTGRSTVIEWEPVQSLNAWRFGLATATGLDLPNSLLKKAPPQLRAYHARAAMLDPASRMASAYIAAGLGVFSSQSMIDLHSAVYNSTDPSDLPATDAWKLREAFAGKDQVAKLAAIRHFLELAGDPLTKEGARATVARAASKITPDSDLESDAPGIISAMLAAGNDKGVARWAGVVGDLGDEAGDRAWAMVALAAPRGTQVDTSNGRINAFIGRDTSKGKFRSKLLVAGLAGLGKIDRDAVNALNRRHALGLERKTKWTELIDGAADRGQAATIRVLAGTGLQAPGWANVPAAQLMHILFGLKRTGQDFAARMIAAEALSRS